MEYVVGLNLVKSFFPSRQPVKRINFRIRIGRPLPYTVERLFEDNTGMHNSDLVRVRKDLRSDTSAEGELKSFSKTVVSSTTFMRLPSHRSLRVQLLQCLHSQFALL